MAVRCKVLVRNRFIAGVASSNPAESMDVRLLLLLCVVQVAATFSTSWSPVQRGSMWHVCLCAIHKPQRDGLGPSWTVTSENK